MDNWNYEIARSYVDSIADVKTRRLTQLFLTKFFLLAVKRYAVPENGEIDLLCFAKIMEEIVTDHELIKRCLEGEEFDSAWIALAGEFEALQRPEAGV